jgi:hypothetical protein
MTKPARVSYWFILITIVLVGWLHLATPLLAALFSYFALSKLRFGTQSKWVPVSLFFIALLGIASGAAYFINQSLVALPKIAETAIPSIIHWAEGRGIELPFTDYASLRALAMETINDAKYFSNFANFARRCFSSSVSSWR